MTVASPSTCLPGTAVSRVLDISAYFNNKGTSSDGENDGTGLAKGATFPSQYLPSGLWRHDGIDFSFPDDWDAQGKDNVRSDGQIIDLPMPIEISSLHLVTVGDDPRGWF